MFVSMVGSYDRGVRQRWISFRVVWVVEALMGDRQRNVMHFRGTGGKIDVDEASVFISCGFYCSSAAKIEILLCRQNGAPSFACK